MCSCVSNHVYMLTKIETCIVNIHILAERDNHLFYLKGKLSTKEMHLKIKALITQTVCKLDHSQLINKSFLHDHGEKWST